MLATATRIGIALDSVMLYVSVSALVILYFVFLRTNWSSAKTADKEVPRHPQSVLDLLSKEQCDALYEWAANQKETSDGTLDLMKWPGWRDVLQARAIQSQSSNESSGPAKKV